MTEIMFERFNVPSYYVANDSVLTLYSTGRTTGIVIDSGEGGTDIVPIVQEIKEKLCYLTPNLEEEMKTTESDIESTYTITICSLETSKLKVEAAPKIPEIAWIWLTNFCSTKMIEFAHMTSTSFLTSSNARRSKTRH